MKSEIQERRPLGRIHSANGCKHRMVRGRVPNQSVSDDANQPDIHERQQNHKDGHNQCCKTIGQSRCETRELTVEAAEDLAHDLVRILRGRRRTGAASWKILEVLIFRIIHWQIEFSRS
jgi:hypothetical protein